jgi:hypothetical protein
MLSGTILGLFNSSTRTELAAIVAAAGSSEALHIGIDNMGVRNKATSILDGTLKRRKPWALLPDGDLWELFENAANSRGLHSIVLSWTKSHPSWQQMAQGTVKIPTAIHNGMADIAADLGIGAQGRQDIQDAFDYLAARQDAIEKLTHRVQRLFVGAPEGRQSCEG